MCNNNDNNTSNTMQPPNNRNHQTTMKQLDLDALVDRCWKLLEACSSPSSSSSQVFIGIGGTPACGKSYIAKQVANRLNTHAPTSKEIAIVIPMDGYHLSRQRLQELAHQGAIFRSDQWQVDDDNHDNDKDSHNDNHNSNTIAVRQVTGRQLTYEQLLARRGAPFTYCPQQLIHDLQHAKHTHHGCFPVYDRSHHDPVSNALSLQPHHKIVLVEGLYLLCLDDPEWAPLHDIWHDTWHIQVSTKETERRLIQRHLHHWTDEKTQQFGGSDQQAAARKAESNDLINAACIQRHSKQHANVIICNESILPDNDNMANNHENHDTNHKNDDEEN